MNGDDVVVVEACSWPKGFVGAPNAEAGPDCSGLAPNEKDVDIAGADEVRLKLKPPILSAGLLLSFGANGLDMPEDAAPKVNIDPVFEGCPKGFTGVGPEPKVILPEGFFCSAPFVSICTGLSSMLIPSSGFGGGVTGRAG